MSMIWLFNTTLLLGAIDGQIRDDARLFIDGEYLTAAEVDAHQERDLLLLQSWTDKWVGRQDVALGRHRVESLTPLGPTICTLERSGQGPAVTTSYLAVRAPLMPSRRRFGRPTGAGNGAGTRGTRRAPSRPAGSGSGRRDARSPGRPCARARPPRAPGRRCHRPAPASGTGTPVPQRRSWSREAGASGVRPRPRSWP